MVIVFVAIIPGEDSSDSVEAKVSEPEPKKVDPYRLQNGSNFKLENLLGRWVTTDDNS